MGRHVWGFTAIAVTAVIASNLLIPVPAIAGCSVAGGFQEYYVLGREDHIYDMFVDTDIGEGGGNDRVTQEAMESVVTLTATANGQIIQYDHWEDGYDADPFSPGPTTETFLLDRGDVLSLKSDGSGTGLRAAVPRWCWWRGPPPSRRPSGRAASTWGPPSRCATPCSRSCRKPTW